MLVVRDLWVTPAGAPDPVVRGVSFEARPGEWLVVTGGNGCGKTTLALAAAGLAPPFRGTAEWCGRPSADPSPRGAGPVLAVLQDPSSQLLQPTVAEELRFTADNLGRDPRETGRVLARLAPRLGFEGWDALDPQTLSAGGQQLILLAAALAARPGLLVADEPCAHLDAAARRRVLELVAEEAASGMTVLWVTQDDDERAAGSRVLEMEPSPLPALGPNSPLPQGPVALEIEVAPDPGGTGPRVRNPEPLRLEVHGPGLLALEGPNGSGKSVLLAAACGLSRCGQIRVSVRSGPVEPPLLVSQFPELLVFQDRVEHELTFAAVSRGVSRELALVEGAILLRRLRMSPERLAKTSTWDLSTGEKRMVELAAALIAPAGLVALDEPTGGLDPERRALLAGLVRERAERSAVLVASQDREWVERLAGIRVSIGEPGQTPSTGKKKRLTET